jgi:hypothetical protein
MGSNNQYETAAHADQQWLLSPPTDFFASRAQKDFFSAVAI